MCEISKIFFDFKSKRRNDEGIVCDGGQSRGLELGREEKVFRVEGGLDYIIILREKLRQVTFSLEVFFFLNGKLFGG
jgi:hypothetical protein